LINPNSYFSNDAKANARAMNRIPGVVNKPSPPKNEDEPKEPEQKGLLSKAASWAKAEVSLVWNGLLSDEALEARLSACRGCDKLDPANEEGKVGWCKACGCGRNARAELTVKGRMPKAKCPLDLWPKKPDT